MSERERRITEIIVQRQPMAEQALSALENIAGVKDGMSKFLQVCRMVIADKDAQSAVSGLNGISERSSSLIDELEMRRADLDAMYKRLTRQTLNIAIIGRARQGKSRLLQTITGLSAAEIPDGSGEFCTGVRSDIINDATVSDSYADVYFLTEKRFIEEAVKPYFDELNRSVNGLNLLPPVSASDFKSYLLPDLDGYEIAPEKKTMVDQHVDHLKELQKNFPKELLGAPVRRIPKEEIRRYVAQDDESGNREGHHDHIAVDRVEIHCKFPQADVGQLRLIDLPGLGDTRLGDTERMVKALKEQVDLAFFLSKPSGTGDAWKDIDVALYSDARSALGSDLPIERWAFWVFNHDSRPGAENIKQCERLQETIEQNRIKVSKTVIVDCTKTDEVAERLINVALEHLAGTIRRSDQEYAGNIQNKVEETIKAVSELMADISAKIKDDDSSHSIDDKKFDDLFRDLWYDLRAELEGLVDDQSPMRLAQEEPCEALKTCIETILEEEENRSGEDLLPSDEYRKLTRAEGGSGSAWQMVLHRNRTYLSKRMQAGLDDILLEVINKLKSDICATLAKAGKLDKRFGPADHTMIESINEYIDGDGDMADICAGFQLLSDWTMSYRSFIQHRIRKSLNMLDPQDKDCRSRGEPMGSDAPGEWLKTNYFQTIGALRDSMDEIYKEPNQAAFAICDEFKDRVIRDRAHEKAGDPVDGSTVMHRAIEDQWRAFYRPIRGDIWPEEFGGTQHIRDMLAKLRRPVEDIVSRCAAENFRFVR